MDTTMTAACGLDCGACPARTAWKTNDNALRMKTAKEWSEQFHADIKPETVNCSGCLDMEGPKFSHCAECDIRACVRTKALANCAACADFSGCGKINGFLQYIPEAKARLEEIRSNP